VKEAYQPGSQNIPIVATKHIQDKDQHEQARFEMEWRSIAGDEQND
jgi:hypothetical protein